MRCATPCCTAKSIPIYKCWPATNPHTGSSCASLNASGDRWRRPAAMRAVRRTRRHLQEKIGHSRRISVCIPNLGTSYLDSPIGRTSHALRPIRTVPQTRTFPQTSSGTLLPPHGARGQRRRRGQGGGLRHRQRLRSEEHTSELQSLMRISYAVFCLKKKKNKQNNTLICT